MPEPSVRIRQFRPADKFRQGQDRDQEPRKLFHPDGSQARAVNSRSTMHKFQAVRAAYQTFTNRSSVSLRCHRQAPRIAIANSLDARMPAKGPQRISALMNRLAAGPQAESERGGEHIQKL